MDKKYFSPAKLETEMSFQPSCKTGLIPTYYMKQIELYNTINQQVKQHKKRVSKKYETLFSIQSLK